MIDADHSLQGPVLLKIQRLGRLESAAIDLNKSLTIFVGRNNTSKTYVAHTIYALHRFGPEFLGDMIHDLIREQKIEQGIPTSREAWHYELDVVTFLIPHLPRFIDRLGERLRDRLPSVFATDDDFFSKTLLTLELAENEVARIRERIRAYKVEFALETEGWQIRFHKSSGSPLIALDCILAKTPTEASDKLGITWLPGVLGVPVTDILARAVLPGCREPFILSTERSAIQLFSRELHGKRSQVIDYVLEFERRTGTSSVDHLKKVTRFYPLAIRDELHFINGLPRHKHLSSPLAPLAARLEALLGGAVVLDDSGDLMYQPAGLSQPLELHVSASSVKSLAGLAFYLRHLASRDGLLVIDEPELNLHPDNQRGIARILSQITRTGLRVLISTHSDYVIRELNSLIALHAPMAAELREKYGYSEIETIEDTSVGAYLFEQTNARPINIQTTGIEVHTIDNEINAMNRVAKDIYFNLQDKPSNT